MPAESFWVTGLLRLQQDVMGAADRALKIDGKAEKCVNVHMTHYTHILYRELFICIYISYIYWVKTKRLAGPGPKLATFPVTWGMYQAGGCRDGPPIGFLLALLFLVILAKGM